MSVRTDDVRDLGSLVDELANVRQRIAESWAKGLTQSQLQALHAREAELARVVKDKSTPVVPTPAPLRRCYCMAHPVPHYHYGKVAS